MIAHRKSSGVLLISALSSVFSVCAQTPPDAGALQQQIEREHPRLMPPSPPPQTSPAPAAIKPDAIRVTVRKFRFVGNTLMSSEQLDSAVAGYLGRSLDFDQLQGAAAAVAAAYRAAGWIVHVYLPQQAIDDGTVTLQIVEAILGQLETEGNPSRIDPAIPRARLESRQQAGQPLNANEIDRGLLLADDLPGVTASATLRPGRQQGETDLVLKLTDEPWFFGDASLDNAGARATGRERLNAALALASPLRLGDLLATNLLHSEGTDYVRLAYSLPAGNDGWRFGMNASYLEYRLVAPEFRALDSHGASRTLGLEANYPLLRSRMKNLFLGIAYDNKTFKNSSNRTTASDYAVDNINLSLTGNLFDSLGGGGANGANLTVTRGRVDLDGSPNQAADAVTTRTHGDFTRIRYGLSRQQLLTADLSLSAAYMGQWANRNLDSSEKLYLGGANGVRAYPANEGGGSTGQMANLELRWQLPAGFTGSLFYDWGKITQNVDNAFAGAPYANNYELRGHGLGLGWLASFGLQLKIVWAHRDGHNPNPTARGRDQDGSLDKDRWWLSASLPF